MKMLKLEDVFDDGRGVGQNLQSQWEARAKGESYKPLEILSHFNAAFRRLNEAAFLLCVS